MLNELTPLADFRRSGLLHVPDQGMRPVCVPMAMTGAHEIVRGNGSTLSQTQLAPDALWSHAWQRGLAGPDGTYLFAIANALEDHGQPELSKWPFDQAAPGATAPLHEAGPPPWMRASFTELPLDEAVLARELLQGRPVVLLVHVTSQFQNADNTTGRIDPPPPSAPKEGLHAVLCVGHAEDNAAKSHFLIRNSWGEAWGAGGYGWLPSDYLDKFATQMGRVSDPQIYLPGANGVSAAM